MGEIFAKHVSDNQLIGTYKGYIYFNIKQCKTSIQNYNTSEGFVRHSSTKDMKMATSYMRKM